MTLPRRSWLSDGPNALSKLSHSLALHFSPSSLIFLSVPLHQKGSFGNPDHPNLGQFHPGDIAWSSGQIRDLGSTTSVHRRELYAEARSLQLALLASLKTAWTLERRSPGSWRQQGGKKSQADKRILVGARAALPSETRFPRSRRSPPAKPSG